MQLRLFPDKFEVGNRVKLVYEPNQNFMMPVGSKGTVRTPPYTPVNKGWISIHFDDAEDMYGPSGDAFWVAEEHLIHIPEL